MRAIALTYLFNEQVPYICVKNPVCACMLIVDMLASASLEELRTPNIVCAIFGS